LSVSIVSPSNDGAVSLEREAMELTGRDGCTSERPEGGIACPYPNGRWAPQPMTEPAPALAGGPKASSPPTSATKAIPILRLRRPIPPVVFKSTPFARSLVRGYEPIRAQVSASTVVRREGIHPPQLLCSELVLAPLR